MPKQQPPVDRELEDVLSRAKTLYPKLVARRAAIAAELETVEAALARLDKLSGTLGSTRTAPSAVATVAPTRPGGKSLTARKLEQPTLFALSRFSEPVGSAEILKALRAQGLAVERYPLQMALKRLRVDGQVRATGKATRLSYELANRSGADDRRRVNGLVGATRPLDP